MQDRASQAQQAAAKAEAAAAQAEVTAQAYTDVNALRARRGELQSQMAEMGKRRTQLTGQMVLTQNSAVKAELQKRVDEIDQRTVRLDAQIARLDDQIAAGAEKAAALAQ